MSLIFKFLKNEGLNDWLCVHLSICNYFEIQLSLLGFGFLFSWRMKKVE